MKRTPKLLRAASVAVVAAAAAIATATALAASPPTVSGLHVSNVGKTSAVLHATIQANGSATSWQFEYGLTTGYGSLTAEHSIKARTTPVSVSATANGLQPGTVYHYALIARNGSGQVVTTDHTFKTTGAPPPGVATGTATDISQHTAILTGTVAPNGAATSWTFQWGTTTSYGNETTGGSVPAKTALTVASPLSGLAAGTTFHYRLVARHGSTVISYGNDMTFMTEPSPRPVPGVQGSTVPHKARRSPFVFTTSGRVNGPEWIPSQYACAGEVGVRYFFAHHRVGFALVPVAPNCTFVAQVRFNHLVGPRRHRHPPQVLHILIYFHGNGYLAPHFGHNERVTLR